jgi:exosortase K
VTRRIGALDALSLGLVLLGAYVLKRHYSLAGAEELGWILRPTAALVEIVTGRLFTWHSGAGFLNRESDVLIAPACAGVNFLIVALVALGSLTMRTRRALAKLSWLAVVPLVAYAATLGVNAARITLWLWLRPLLARSVGPELEGWHRASGVVVYLSALFLLYAGASHALGREHERRSLGVVVGPLLKLGVPLALYLGVTLGVPLLNGGASTPYYAHALQVLAVSFAVMLAVSAGTCQSSIPSRAQRSPKS